MSALFCFDDSLWKHAIFLRHKHFLNSDSDLDKSNIILAFITQPRQFRLFCWGIFDDFAEAKCHFCPFYCSFYQWHLLHASVNCQGCYLVGQITYISFKHTRMYISFNTERTFYHSFYYFSLTGYFLQPLHQILVEKWWIIEFRKWSKDFSQITFFMSRAFEFCDLT